jgi:hypothetical protein
MQARPLGIWDAHRTAVARVRWAAGLTAAVLGVLSLGCRHDAYRDAYLEMLNAEKRVLEDRLYETQYNYEQALAELEAERGNTKDGKKPAGRARSSGSEKPLTEPAGDDSRSIPELPKIELPPDLEEGKRKKPAPTAVRAASAAVRESAVGSAKKRPLSEDELAAAIVSALDQRVELIHLNPRLTGGADLDGQPGDDGICVLIEPRNRSGEFVPEPARISIALLDPAKSGDAARVARWDVDPEAAGGFLQTETLDRGLLLRLPWHDAVPENKRLHVFVRYMTADGRKLETDREINIDSADMVAHSWTPRRTPLPEKAPGGEATVGWLQKDDAEQPVVVQAVAEQPAKIQSPREAHRGTAHGASGASATPTGRFWKPDR